MQAPSSPNGVVITACEANSLTSSTKDADAALRALRLSLNSRVDQTARGSLNQTSTGNDFLSNTNKIDGASAASQSHANPAIAGGSIPPINSQQSLNRSSSHSLWSSIVKNGRRIYGSTVSVTSSITFADDLTSQDLNMSEHSIDVRLFGDGDQARNDYQPSIPLRHDSISAAGLSSSGFMNFSNHTKAANLKRIEEENHMDSSSTLPPSSKIHNNHNNSDDSNVKAGAWCTTSATSADRSPKQPGRKTSITDSISQRESRLSSTTTPSVTENSSILSTRSNEFTNNSRDSLPSYPSRKCSLQSVVMGNNSGHARNAVILEEGLSQSFDTPSPEFHDEVGDDEKEDIAGKI